MAFFEREIRLLIRQKIAYALALPAPTYTRRDIRLPDIPGKAMVVVGMRRSGKTEVPLAVSGRPTCCGRDALLFFSFEDERLAEMTTGELQLVVEEYFNLCPERRDRERVTFFLDEIQLAPGWEPFTRRNDEIYCLARRAR